MEMNVVNRCVYSFDANDSYHVLLKHEQQKKQKLVRQMNEENAKE